MSILTFLLVCLLITMILIVTGFVYFLIQKIRNKMNQNVNQFQTLYSIVNDEIQSQTTTVKNSATDALLWLKRYLKK